MMLLRKWTVEVALRLTSLLLSLCIFSKKCFAGREAKSWRLFRFLVSWLSRSHMTRKQRWCGRSPVLGDPCLTRQTCNFIYPISGARIEAWVVMRTDKSTGSSIKEAFMSRVLEALHAVLANLCADHKATVWLYRLGTRKLLEGLDHISSWKWCEPNVLRDFGDSSLWFQMECLTEIGSRCCNGSSEWVCDGAGCESERE